VSATLVAEDRLVIALERTMAMLFPLLNPSLRTEVDDTVEHLSSVRLSNISDFHSKLL
jgi:hypothetical protein